MSDISVTAGPSTDEGFASTVHVVDPDGSQTTHAVTLSRTTFERLGADTETPERFVERCFGFLLAREPKESILRTFDIDVISVYFPEFPTEISRSE